MSIELPDWLRGTLLLGRDGAGNIIPILIDAAGQINVLLRGVDVLGNVHTVRTDAAGQLYAILRGAGGVDVGVDAFGNLTAVLKGIFGGALHTIAVDADGRIEAFLMDGADQWSQTLRVGTAEASGRANPIHSYDWRGNVIYFCDFGLGIPSGYTTLSGAGAAVVLAPEYWRNGGYSLKLTGGSTVNHLAQWNVNIATTNTYRLGLSAEFSIAPNATAFELRFDLDFAGLHKSFGLRVNITALQLQYINAAGAWTNFHPITFTPLATNFYKMKLVTNAFTGDYIRCLYNDEEYPMTMYAGVNAAGTGAAFTTFSVGIESRNAVNDVAYVDSFVVTTNEPPPP